MLFRSLKFSTGIEFILGNAISVHSRANTLGKENLGSRGFGLLKSPIFIPYVASGRNRAISWLAAQSAKAKAAIVRPKPKPFLIKPPIIAIGLTKMGGVKAIPTVLGNRKIPVIVNKAMASKPMRSELLKRLSDPGDEEKAALT